MDAEIIARISASLQALIVRESRMGDEGGRQLDDFAPAVHCYNENRHPFRLFMARG